MNYQPAEAIASAIAGRGAPRIPRVIPGTSSTPDTRDLRGSLGWAVSQMEFF